MIGKIISQYKILEQIGRGGMGVVYKALDTRLNRYVALKFLPSLVAEDSAAKTRFLHEAQAISSLNHPHIATIHDVQEVGEHKFIVLEYLEGGTLRAKVRSQRLDLKEVIEYAIQIAEGLAHAHKKGAVHRDLKTENLMLTSEGQIKITDFGLAKLKDAARVTKSGSIVGTAAYMSPEQAQGVEVDHRSDIFSFGIVLYEMATGELPFKGEYEAALLYEIINMPAPPMQPIRADLPDELERIVSKAMEKNREDRYQHVKEMLVDLKRLRKELESREILARIGRPRLADVRTRKRAFATAGVVAFVLLSTGVFVLRSKSPEPSVQMISRTLKAPSFDVKDPNISADGNLVVYVAEEKGIPNLYLAHVSGGEPIKISNQTIRNPKSAPCFSPDASNIIYAQSSTTCPGLCCRHDIYVVPALGGPPKKLIGNGGLPIWSPDGKNIAFFRPNGGGLALWRAGANGSAEKKITDIGKPVSAYNAAWSPNSKQIAFLRNFRSSAKERYTEIFIYDLICGKERQLTFDKKPIDDFCWTTTNEIIFNSTRGGSVNLWVMPAKGGAAKRLTVASGVDRFPRISRDAKRLVYVNESGAISNLWMANLETKELDQLTYQDTHIYGPSFSPDGNTISYLSHPFEGAEEGQVFICNKDGSEPMQVTSEMADHYDLCWSEDGKSIAYTLVWRDTIAGNPDSVHLDMSIMVLDLETNDVRKIGEGILCDWSPDGKYVLYHPPHLKDLERNIVVLKAVAQNAPIKQFKGREGGKLPAFSRDSKSVIYADSVGFWIAPIENGRAKLLYKRPEGELFDSLQETPDGQAITYLKKDTKTQVIKLLRISKSGIGPEELFVLPDGSHLEYTISPDMKTVVFPRQQSTNKIVLLDNFR